jgi:class 3 adenylate cyclase
MSTDEIESIRQDLEAAEGELGTLLGVLDRLIALRRIGNIALELERSLGQKLLGVGEPLLAYDALTGALRALGQKPRDPRLRQLRGLALARMGETRRACRELRTLVAEPQSAPSLKEETLGILARTYKDLGFQQRDRRPDPARRYWERSRRIYHRAYKDTGSYWTGINAATLSLLLEQPDEARSLASAIFTDCLARWDRSKPTPPPEPQEDRYWLSATLGEAALILGRIEDTVRWYGEANSIGRQHRRFGDMGSTRAQLRAILLPALKLSPSLLDDLFPIPGLALFTGHMIDRPGRLRPRFPALPTLEREVKAAIGSWLAEQDVLVGYASAACGSDILFLEAVHERNGETRVVLPYHRDLFREDSVDIIPGANWAERFERVLSYSKAQTLSGHRLELGGISYEYANRFLHGLAIIQAAQLGAPSKHLAVWDMRPGDGPGGAADTVNRWGSQGYGVSIIDIEQILARHRPAPVSAGPSLPEVVLPRPGVLRGSHLVALFFADVKGFSKLAEPDLPRFVEAFLGLVAREIDSLPQSDQPLKRNTWGDAIYLVLPDVAVAGRLALAINESVCRTSWTSLGFPTDLKLRTGLHAAPTYRCTDPITKRDRFLGTHISMAARIEPIVKPGRVYASQAFACLAAESRVDDFACRYVGLMALPKKWGTIPIYRVERRSVSQAEES